MNYWLFADAHLGHSKMLLPEYCSRPHGYEQLILRNLKHYVLPDDVLIDLGDTCIGGDEYWHAQIMAACPACKKWRVNGNHDRKSKGWYLKHGWDFVGEEIILEVYGKRVLLSHRPIVDRDDYDLNVHGHLHYPPHHSYVASSKQRLIHMEHTYAPVRLREVVENWKSLTLTQQAPVRWAKNLILRRKD